jgi:hypothetical protein
VFDRLNNLTPEQRTHQRQTVSRLLQSWDETSDEDEENWEELKTSLDRNRNSYRPPLPMNQNFILLDTGPLGMITNHPGNSKCQAIQQWFSTMSDRILLPEIS